MATFDRLPAEIILLIVSKLHNIEDYLSLNSTCHLIHEILARTTSQAILRLLVSSAPTFCSPHPYFLTAALARQTAKRVLADATTRKPLLIDAFRGGIESLYEFCLSNAPDGLSLDDIRKLHNMRFSIINPLSDTIDGLAGKRWYDTPDFWDGGVSEPATLYAEASRATMQIIIYGELFGSTMDLFLEKGNQEIGDSAIFTMEDRLEFIKYCIEDANCSSWGPFEVKDIGPYADRDKIDREDQVALCHILTCRRWRLLWRDVASKVSGESTLSTGSAVNEYKAHYYPDSGTESATRWGDIDDIEEEDWRQTLYRDALVSQGLEGMQLATLPLDKVDEKVLDKAKWIKTKIANMDHPFEVNTIGEEEDISVSVAPDLSKEVETASKGRYM